MNKIVLLRRARTFEGEKTGSWNLIGLPRIGLLAWHPRCKSTRTGWYYNRHGRCGLKACLNLPVLGDFSFWI